MMQGRRRLEGAALALAILGATLIIPPLINVFNVPQLLFGAPTGAVYMFAVWLGLIGATAWISRLMHTQSGDEEPQQETRDKD